MRNEDAPFFSTVIISKGTNEKMIPVFLQTSLIDRLVTSFFVKGTNNDR